MKREEMKLEEILTDLFESEMDDEMECALVIVDPDTLINYYDISPTSAWFEEGTYYDCGEEMTYTKLSEIFKEIIERVMMKMDLVQDWNWTGLDYVEIAMKKVS